ncbi:MAG: class I SAM-dependent methyltransferase, partial [Blastocatellia bacterium]
RRCTLFPIMSIDEATVRALSQDSDRARKRDEWQRPAEVMDALGVKPGHRVADIGSGYGYFTFRLAARVGAEGKVYAVDIDREAINKVRQRSWCARKSLATGLSSKRPGWASMTLSTARRCTFSSSKAHYPIRRRLRGKRFRGWLSRKKSTACALRSKSCDELPPLQMRYPTFLQTILGANFLSYSTPTEGGKAGATLKIPEET